jgi:hypothetical protein
LQEVENLKLEVGSGEVTDLIKDTIVLSFLGKLENQIVLPESHDYCWLHGNKWALKLKVRGTIKLGNNSIA